MNRFFDSKPRFPILLQVISVAAFIYFVHLFFTHFVDRPEHKKSFFNAHVERAIPYAQQISESLTAEILQSAETGTPFTANILAQFDSRPGMADALIIDCSGAIYVSKNTTLTGNSILTPSTLTLSAGLKYLQPAIYNQVATTGVSISRDIANEKRVQLSSLPCISQSQHRFPHAVLFLFFDWADLIETDMSLVKGITTRERVKWAILSVLVLSLAALSIVPRALLFLKALSQAESDAYQPQHDDQPLDELDLIRQSFDKVVMSFRDRLKSEKQVSAKLALGYAAFEHSHQAICILSSDQRVLDINEAYEKITGYTRAEVIGRSLVSILPEELSKGKNPDAVANILLEGAPIESWGYKKNGARIRKHFQLSAYKDTEQPGICYFLTIRDATREHEQKERLELQAKTDPLTGIYNRRRFDADLNDLIESGNKNFAVGIINLDSMREINAEYGKLAGDKVIVEAGRRLLLAVSGSRNRVYRFEGDEFYVLFAEIDGDQELERQARTLLSLLLGEVKHASLSIELTAGLGVAKFKDTKDIDSQESANLTLTQANLALRQAKNSGRSKLVLARDVVLAAERRRLGISLALKSSKLTDQLQLSYVPKVDIRHGILAGADAVLSWESAQSGYVPVEELLNQAEASGDITRIDDWVIAKALSDTARFAEQIDGFQTAIKLSSQQLQKNSFTKSFLRQLCLSGVSEESIAIEIAGRETSQNMKSLVPVLKELRGAGISIHMEEFGIGYSWLTELQELPLDALKIKKLFLQGQPNLKIIKTIISLAQAMKIPVIAEGVESSYHLNLLKEMGCDFCLGYLYSEPVSLRDDNGAESILANWQRSIEAVMP